MRQLYRALMKSELYRYLPEHLQTLMAKRHKKWQPMEKAQVRKVLGHLHLMRNLPEYYLRNFTISSVQSVVRLQFNCDGAQIIHARDFDQFVEQNLPCCQPGTQSLGSQSSG